MVMSATVMVIVFMIVFSELYQDNLTEKKQIIMEDFGYSLQNEFVMASESKPGYSRTFNLPYNLEGFDYEIYILSSVLIINYTDGVFPFKIPDTNGTIIKGDNEIQNINHTICLNC